ncbi:uncharacterized protein LOC120641511 isoform X2 [Panicum virgatum]|uniref:uncharacterized protein LOC120641511 isoform X2 n=1 Tax=Panicum virgatum TaxID=38727 RepID=UPI0019D50A2E|nr:uncharacterized protein LOC120641511 isoform X2 [Panicum virgatum]
MEYWTGDALSDNVNQDDMTEFRPKLAAILLLSEANIRKGCPYLAIDVVGSPNDVVEIENPMTIDDTPAKTTQCGQSEEKATHTRLDDCMLSQGKRTQDMPMTRTRMNTYSLISMLDMPMSREELAEILCDYIMSIEDVGTLQKTWVRSFKPYKMALTVKELQMSLRNDQPMSTSSFNMGVRILGYNEYKALQYSKSVMPTHFMDLRFCKLCDVERDIKYRKNPNAESLAEAIGRVTWLDYDMTCCRYFLMPWVKSTNFMLFVLDHKDKKFTWIDPTSTPEW